MIRAVAIIAEASIDMSAFADERKFAAWAGVASDNNESADKKKIKMSPRQPTPEKSFDPSRSRG